MRKSSVLLVAVLLLSSLPLFASSYTTNTDTKKYELTFRLSPYSMQHIKYYDNIPSRRTSNYGAGASVGFYYNYDHLLAFGTNVAYEYHNFKGFHYYSDLKVDGRFRFRIVNSKDNKFRLYLHEGLGADFVFRDDRDYGCYPLMIVGGLDAAIKLNDKWTLNTGCDCSFTVQIESHVFHLTTFLGATYHFGKEVTE